MRYQEIMELAGVKRFKDMTSEEVLRFIHEKLGNGKMRVLGKGAHGAALQIGDVVYKLWMRDSAYTDFVKYCQKHPNNRFLPRFTSAIKQMPAFFDRHKEAPDIVNYVKMEKLQPIMNNSYEDYEFKFNIPVDAEDGYGDVSIVTLGMLDGFFTHVSDTPNIFEKFITTFSQYREFNYKVEYMTEDLKLFISTMNDLKRLNHKLDLHDGNLMLRGEQLVILDPIYNPDDLKLARQFEQYDDGMLDKSEHGKPGVTSKFSQQKGRP